MVAKKKVKKSQATPVKVTNEETEAQFTSNHPDSKPPFRVRPNDSGFVEGIDPVRLNQLLDDLDVEEFLAKHPQ